MYIFQHASNAEQMRKDALRTGRTLAFVPTMGALHAGHAALIKSAKEAGNYAVASVYVNPLQFTQSADFDKYPKRLEADLELLHSVGCEAVYLPITGEIYPPEAVVENYNLGTLDTVLEGEHRPGHFQGVCAVVHRLLSIVQPDKLYLGQKDWQQCRVIERLLQLTGLHTRIQLHTAPTIRQDNGLALSSRNLRLSNDALQKAPLLFELLNGFQNIRQLEDIAVAEATATARLNASGFQPEYVQVRNAANLEAPAEADAQWAVLAAAWLNGVRLIDNIIIDR